MINFTEIINACIAGVFTIITTVVLVTIQSRMKDKMAAEVVGNAVKNSLGAIQQATIGEVLKVSPKAQVPGVSPLMAVGIQYVLNHASEEAARVGVTPEKIAEKISAQIGLQNVAANIATAASPAPTPEPVGPLASTGHAALP